MKELRKNLSIEITKKIYAFMCSKDLLRQEIKDLSSTYSYSIFIFLQDIIMIHETPIFLIRIYKPSDWIFGGKWNEKHKERESVIEERF